MWIPESKLFFDYEEAYAYFLEMAPALPKKSEDEEDYDENANTLYEGDDKVNQYINPRYPQVWQGYNIIENRVQNPDAFLRPEGAVFAQYIF